ncbi:MAG TPA: hypothetical protein PLL88_10780 [Anaerolineaceae bacterium]|nr:hypothetical protein [Anaerolineaceae bacterium]
MLTSDQLDVLMEPIINLYQEFEERAIIDIVRRLIKMNFDSPSAAWMVQRLSESGMLYEEILERISQLTGKSELELQRIFRKAGVKTLQFDDVIYKAADLQPLPLNLSPAMTQVLAAGLRKTQGVVRNFTLTTASAGQELFISVADRVYLEVSSGAFDYNSAMRQAVKQVASQGLTTINYASGHRDQLDVAMRRTLLTGVGQTVGNLQLARADEMGCDLVAVSAHIGARNKGVGPMNHESWQGKVYSRSGTNPKYKPFIETTGYGTGPGLMGWNCRHNFYPFFEGISENAYSSSELDSYERKRVTYQGQEMSVYDASQIQRGIERKIRYWKRQAGGLEAAGLDNTFERLKMGEWQAEMRQFVKETGLIRQSEREQINGLGKIRALTKKTVVEQTIANIPALSNTGRKIINIGEIGENIAPIIQSRSSAKIVQATDDVLKHIEKHKDQFDILKAKNMLPEVLNNPKFLFQGKKKTSLQFIEDFDEKYFLMIPIKYLPNELWLETLTIEEKERFLRRWMKRELLYKRE